METALILKTTKKIKTTKKWRRPYVENILKNENDTKNEHDLNSITWKLLMTFHLESHSKTYSKPEILSAV